MRLLPLAAALAALLAASHASLLEAAALAAPRHPRAAVRAARSGTAALEWRSCGSKKDPMRLQKLELLPNPVKVPGIMRAEMALLVKEAIQPPIKMSVQVEKEVALPLGLGSTWVQLPCPGDSCSVPDVCSPELLPRDGSVCPAPSLDGRPADYNTTSAWRACACPIPKGLYAMPPLEFNLSSPAVLLPDYLLNGGFYVKMKLTRHKRRLACIETQLDLDF
ncbi:ganglioside GM2 activator-like [Cloeon dipterum]|uniref:ganglioside GM2 activator-like n=1 Tax=Cloeon dipterum TaxID=197152 RepID=UPI0032209A86